MLDFSWMILESWMTWRRVFWNSLLGECWHARSRFIYHPGFFLILSHQSAVPDSMLIGLCNYFGLACIGRQSTELNNRICNSQCVMVLLLIVIMLIVASTARAAIHMTV